MIQILRYTGLRPGEARKLRWDHLHLDEGFIIIPAHEHKTGNTAKHPTDRVVPFLEEAREIFLRRKEPHVFLNGVNKPWDNDTFAHKFKRIRTLAGLDRADQNGEFIVPYSLRHSALTEYATKEGWGMFQLMTVAGHTTPLMTQRYVHTNAHDLKRAAEEGRARRKTAEATKKAGENTSGGPPASSPGETP